MQRRKVFGWVLFLTWCLGVTIRLLMFSLQHSDFVYFDQPTYGHIFAVRAHNFLKGRGFVGHDEQVRHAMIHSLDGHRMREFNEIHHLEPKEGYYPDDYETLGYSVWIALVWKIVGQERFYEVRLFQTLVSSFMVFPIFVIGRRFFSVPVGLVAAGIWAIFLPEVRFSTMMLRETWVTWSTILFLWAMSLAYVKGHLAPGWWKAALLAGLFALLGAYMRSSAVFFFPWVLMATLFLWGTRNMLKFSSLTMIILFLGLFPWAKRNHDLFGRWELRGWFHYALLSGLCEEDVSLYRLDPLAGKGTVQGEPLPDTSRLSLSPEDSEFKRQVIQIYKERPLWIIKISLKRFVKCIFASYFWGVDDDVYMSSRGLTLRERLRVYLQHPMLILKWISEKLFYPVAFVIFILGKGTRRQSWVLFAAMMYFPAFHSVTIFQTRFLFPGVWPICIFSAMAVVAGVALYQQKRKLGAAG